MSFKFVKKFIKGVTVLKKVVGKTNKGVVKGTFVAAVAVSSSSQEVLTPVQYGKASALLMSKLSNGMKVTTHQPDLIIGSGDGCKEGYVDLKNKKVLTVDGMFNRFKKSLGKKPKHSKVVPLPDTRPYVVKECNTELLCVTNATTSSQDLKKEVSDTQLKPTEVLKEETKILYLDNPCVCSEENTLYVFGNYEGTLLNTCRRPEIDQVTHRPIQLNFAHQNYLITTLTGSSKFEQLSIDSTDNSSREISTKGSELEKLSIDFTKISSKESNNGIELDDDIESKMTFDFTMFAYNSGRISAMSFSEEHICINNEQCKYVFFEEEDFDQYMVHQEMVDLKTKMVQVHGQPPMEYFQNYREAKLALTEENLSMVDLSNKRMMSDANRYQNMQEAPLEQYCLKTNGPDGIVKCLHGSLKAIDPSEVQFKKDDLDAICRNEIGVKSANLFPYSLCSNEDKIECMNGWVDNFSPNEIGVKCLQDWLGPNLQVRCSSSLQGEISGPVLMQHSMHPEKDKLLENELPKYDIKHGCTSEILSINQFTKSPLVAVSNTFEKLNADSSCCQNHIKLHTENTPSCGNENPYKGFKYKEPILEKHTKTSKLEDCCCKSVKHKGVQEPTQYAPEHITEERKYNQCSSASINSAQKTIALPIVLKCLRILLLANQVSSSDSKLIQNPALVENSGVPESFLEAFLQDLLKYALLTAVILYIVYSVYCILQDAFLQHGINQQQRVENAQNAVADGNNQEQRLRNAQAPVQHIIRLESYPIQCEEDLRNRGLLDLRRNRALEPRGEESPYIDLRNQRRLLVSLHVYNHIQ